MAITIICPSCEYIGKIKKSRSKTVKVLLIMSIIAFPLLFISPVIFDPKIAPLESTKPSVHAAIITIWFLLLISSFIVLLISIFKRQKICPNCHMQLSEIYRAIKRVRINGKEQVMAYPVFVQLIREGKISDDDEVLQQSANQQE